MSRTNWKDLPNTTTPITAANLKADYDDLNQITSSSASNGCIKIGNIGIEWGIASVTSTDTPTTTGGNTVYDAKSSAINFQNTYSKIPAVIVCWSGSYYNQTSTYTTNKSISSAQVGGYLYTANSTRNISWLVIGVLS